MERRLEKLLEELDKYYHSHSIISKPQCTVGDLLEKKIPSDLILEASARDLIRDANHPLITKTFGRANDKDIPCIITIKGSAYLNQIRLKNAVEDLSNSIKDFNKSSSIAYSQLNDSIRKFDESSNTASNKLINLTQILTLFTIFLVWLTFVEITKSWLEGSFGDFAIYIINIPTTILLIVIVIGVWRIQNKK